MEKVRCSPRIDQFPVRVDPIPVRLQEVDLFGVFALKRAGDFRIGAHRVAAERGRVLVKGGLQVFHDGFRGQAGQFGRQGRERGRNRSSQIRSRHLP